MGSSIVIPGLAVTDYPGTTLTNSRRTHDALGGFWTRLFREPWTIRGLTLGQSEELLQRYYDLVEAVDSLAVRQVPELHRERWFPLVLRRSEMRVFPFVFRPEDDPEGAVFGRQPNASLWHSGETFRFGRPRQPTASLYAFPLDPSVHRLPLLVNRLVNPSRVLVHQIDYVVRDGEIIFLEDPFVRPEFQVQPRLGENGQPAMFQAEPDWYPWTDANGQPDPYHPPERRDDPTGLQPDLEVRMWGGHAGLDIDRLYEAFGYIFGVRHPDPEQYRLILEKIVLLFTSGPTVNALTAICNAFLGLRQVETPGEVVEDAYEVSGRKYVVTSASVYEAPAGHGFSDLVWTGTEPRKGRVLQVGDQVFTGVEYHDHVSTPGWWLREFQAMEGRQIQPGSARVSVPGFMFLGSYTGPLVFLNDTAPPEHAIGVVAPAAGDIVFPFVSGTAPEDAATFNANLNRDPAGQARVRALLKQHAEGHGGRVNPLDFLFRYFFQINTALVRIRFFEVEQAARFTAFFRVIADCLPKHVLLVFSFEFFLPEDELAMFPGADDAAGRLDADTSNGAGVIQGPAPARHPPIRLPFGPAAVESDPYRLFTLGRLPVDPYTGLPVTPGAEPRAMEDAAQTWTSRDEPPPGPRPQAFLFWSLFR